MFELVNLDEVFLSDAATDLFRDACRVWKNVCDRDALLCETFASMARLSMEQTNGRRLAYDIMIMVIAVRAKIGNLPLVALMATNAALGCLPRNEANDVLSSDFSRLVQEVMYTEEETLKALAQVVSHFI